MAVELKSKSIVFKIRDGYSKESPMKDVGPDEWVRFDHLEYEKFQWDSNLFARKYGTKDEVEARPAEEKPKPKPQSKRRSKPKPKPEEAPEPIATSEESD